MSRRSALLVSNPTSLEETPTRLLEERESNSLDSELLETTMTSRKAVVAAEVEEVAEVEEAVVIVTTEAHAEVAEVATVAREAKSSLRKLSQLSEVVASATAAAKVSVKGLDHSCAF